MLVALVSEIFVESVQEAAVAFGMSQAFVGFVASWAAGIRWELASRWWTGRRRWALRFQALARTGWISA